MGKYEQREKCTHVLYVKPYNTCGNFSLCSYFTRSYVKPGILVSKKEHHLFGVSNNSNYTYCGQPDSVSHTFIGCHHFKQFFQNVLQHFNEENAISFTQSDEELLFGKSLNTIGQLQRPPLQKKLNYYMLLAKY